MPVKISGPQLFSKYQAQWIERRFKPQRIEVRPDNLVLSLPPASQAARVLRDQLGTKLDHQRVMDAIFEAVQVRWEELGWYNRKGMLCPPVFERSVKLGLFFGSFSPVHLGHLTMMLGSRFFGDLDAIVVAPGGNVPTKPFALSYQVRKELLMDATSFFDDIFITDIRQDMSRVLTELKIDEQPRITRRRFIDLRFLLTANPHVEWKYFVVGADKVREYAVSQRNNYQLIRGVLHPEEINVLYFDRDGKDVAVPTEEPQNSWYRRLFGEGFFVRSDTYPSFDTSSSSIRKGIVDNSVKTLSNYLHFDTVRALFEPRHLGGRGGNFRLADVFHLEHQYNRLRRGRVPEGEKASLIRHINEQRALCLLKGLYKAGNL